MAVGAGAFDGPEHPLSGGQMLTRPGQQPGVTVGIGADLDLGADATERVDQRGSVSVGVGVHSNRAATLVGVGDGGHAGVGGEDSVGVGERVDGRGEGFRPGSGPRYCRMWTAAGRAGLTHFSPSGTPRAWAISRATFAAGSTPPIPGFTPWLSFSDTHFTAGCAALSAKVCGSKSPSRVQAPK
jgi:hypothetical protein